MGSGSVAARGVPAGFLSGLPKGHKPGTKPEEAGMGSGGIKQEEKGGDVVQEQKAEKPEEPPSTQPSLALEA